MARNGIIHELFWNPAKQEGYMTLQGLAPLDPSKGVYQLWIFDARRDQRYPIDGGVFTVRNPTPRRWIPFRAPLPVEKPTLFAITLEPPGGVVLSHCLSNHAGGAVGRPVKAIVRGPGDRAHVGPSPVTVADASGSGIRGNRTGFASPRSRERQRRQSRRHHAAGPSPVTVADAPGSEMREPATAYPDGGRKRQRRLNSSELTLRRSCSRPDPPASPSYGPSGR